MEKVIQVFYTAYAWFISCLLWSVGYIIAVVSTVGSKDKENKYNSIERMFSRLMFKFIGVNIDVTGLENIPDKGPVIFVLNHQSFLDIKLSLAVIPRNFSFISKDIIFKIPVLGRYMRISGHIGMRRSNERNAYATLKEVIKKLDSGKSIVFFPEGTRSSNGKRGEFKRGISMVILKSGRKVVPAAIIGSGRFLSKNSYLANPRNRNIRVNFGRPLEFLKSEEEDRSLSKEVLTKVRSEVSKLLYN